MYLSELLGAVADQPALEGVIATVDDDVELTDVVHDSRAITRGSLFCCIVGEVHDGHDHAPAAVAGGASALLVERPLGLGVPEMTVRSVRKAIGPVASAVAGNPSRELTVVGVTGTNGKTTTTHLLGSIFSSAAVRCGLIGTLTGVRTTPEAPELQRQLAGMVRDGVGAVAMEVSSHSLDQHRVDGTRFAVAVFTNLSRDHLDHHGDMARYFQAKARLFDPTFTETAVVNLDDPHGRLLSDASTVRVVGFSLDDAEDLQVDDHGSTFTWRGVQVQLDLVGRFNVSNALAAATAAAELGIGVEDIAAGLRSAPAVSGRFERVEMGQPFLVAVDYAHTPDGLEQLLTAGRELVSGGRLIVVFGAGGDRDPSKRAPMGEVAGRLADVVVLTTDNPRHEDQAAIIDDVQRGIEATTHLHIEPDRATAIREAVQMAGSGDVLLVAGKGHETTQTVGERVTHFDDREVLRAALAELGHQEATG